MFLHHPLSQMYTNIFIYIYTYIWIFINYTYVIRWKQSLSDSLIKGRIIIRTRAKLWGLQWNPEIAECYPINSYPGCTGVRRTEQDIWRPYLFRCTMQRNPWQLLIELFVMFHLMPEISNDHLYLKVDTTEQISFLKILLTFYSRSPWTFTRDTFNRHIRILSVVYKTI